MKILFRAESDNSEYSADCDFAIVDMTPALWQEVRRRVKLARRIFQADGDLWRLCFWGGTAEFHPYRLVMACEDAVFAATEGPEDAKSAAASAWSAQIDDPGYALLPSGVDLAAHPAESTECDQMNVRCLPHCGKPEFDIAWTAMPKHADFSVATRDLPLAVLESYFRKG
jgi:hypothetical protein